MEILNKLTCALLGLFIVVASMPTHPTQNIIPPSLQQEIDTIILESMQRQHVPGAAISLIKNNGELLYTKGYGLRDIENNLPADANTLFAIGSASKSFTAVVVAKKLHELFSDLGAAVLDTPIRTLAPTYNFTLGDRYRSEHVNFRDLLAHRVCQIGELSGLIAQAYEGKDDFFYRYRYAPEMCGFRTSLSYNNVMIAMAGDIVAHMANTTYDELLSQFFQDLGMMSTTWIKMADDHNNMMGRSIPYIWKDGGLMKYNPDLLKSVAHIYGGGGILTSANDMAKYMQLHLNKGKIGDTQVVPEAVMKWITTISNYNMGDGTLKTGEHPDAIIDTSFGYGLSMFMGTYDGWARFGHSGYIPPYDTSMNMFPGVGIGIYITANGPGPLLEAGNMTGQIFHLLNGSTRKPNAILSAQDNLDVSMYHSEDVNAVPNLQKIDAHQNPKEIQMSLSDAVGTYGSGFNGEMNITLRTNSIGIEQLYWKYGKMTEAWLVQVSPSSFALSKWESDIWMTYWATGLGYGSVVLKFLDDDTIQYFEFGAQLSTDFVRDLKVEHLPQVPWDPESCS